MDSQVVQLLVDVANSVQRVELDGTLSRLGARGKTVLVSLSAPYRGLSRIPAIAVVGCEAPGRVVLRLATDKKWYAFGGNEGRVFLQSVEGDRREPKPPPKVSSNLKYLYSINSDAGRKLYVGGWQKTSVLAATIPPEQTLINAQLDNLGGDLWSVNYSVSLGLAPDGTYERLQLVQVAGQTDTILQKLSREDYGQATKRLSSRGYGFWSRENPVNLRFNQTRNDEGYTVYLRTGNGLGATYYDDYFGDRGLRAQVFTISSEVIAQSRTDINAFVLPGLRVAQYADAIFENVRDYNWFLCETLRVNQGATEGVGKLATGSLGLTISFCWLDLQGIHRLPDTNTNLSVLDQYQSFIDIVERKLYAVAKADLDFEQEKTLSVSVFSASLQLLKKISIKVYQRDQLGSAVLHSASYHPG